MEGGGNGWKGGGVGGMGGRVEGWGEWVEGWRGGERWRTENTSKQPGSHACLNLILRFSSKTKTGSGVCN